MARPKWWYGPEYRKYTNPPRQDDKPLCSRYKHEDYVSYITEAECFVCGNGGDTYASAYWGEDNVGFVNLSTFEMMRLEINRYDDHGELIEEPAGYMSSVGLTDKETDS